MEVSKQDVELLARYGGARSRLETALYDWRLSTTLIGAARRLAELSRCADELCGVVTALADRGAFYQPGAGSTNDALEEGSL